MYISVSYSSKGMATLGLPGENMRRGGKEREGSRQRRMTPKATGELSE